MKMTTKTRFKPDFAVSLLIHLMVFPVFLVLPACVSMPNSPVEDPRKKILLDQALDAVALERGDLSIRSDLHENLFVLNRFKRWMELPAKAPSEAGQAAADLFRAADTPSLWFQELAKLGDRIGVNPLPLADFPDPELPPELPLEWSRAIRLLLKAMATGEQKIVEMTGALSPYEIKLIQRHLYPDFPRAGEFEKEAVEFPGHREKKAALRAAGKVKMETLLQVSLTLLVAISQVMDILEETNDPQTSIPSCSFMTPQGRVKIGGRGPDAHEGDAALIIDAGGDDLYRGKVASGREGKCAVVIDLAGNDVYLGEALTQGAGFWGVGVLLDAAGDDLYRAGDLSQGSGLFGAGLLLDRAGSDTYVGGAFSQAASSWGWGGLIDLGGEDAYQCRYAGQAFAGVGGISGLCDLEGNDKYLSGTNAPDPREPDMNQSFSQGFAMGTRNMAAGGLALLADKSGNDLYQCRYFGQGASYWMGVGILYDQAGKDTYVARRYAQGAGIHYSVGLLLDAGGDDHTVSWGVSQGCGHDYGIGILVNQSGQDTYVADWLSTGASEANGIGIFVDNSGEDGYDINSGMGVGNLDETRRAGGLGLFLDAGGKDRYSIKGSNNRTWGKNRWGIGIDQEAGGRSGLELRVSEETAPRVDESRGRAVDQGIPVSRELARAVSLPLSERVGALLRLASHWGMDKDTPKQAEETLLSLPPERSVPAVADFLDTPDIMTLIVMGRVFAVHAFHAVPVLIRKADDPDPLVQARAFYFLGRLRDSRALEACLAGVTNPSWKIRAGAIRAIGEILNRGRLENLVPMSESLLEARTKLDPGIIWKYLENKEKAPGILSVLARALPLGYETYERFSMPASSREREARPDDLARFTYDHIEGALPLLQRCIRDIRLSDPVAEKLTASLEDPDPAVVKAAAYALGQLRYLPALPRLISLLDDPNPWVRDSAVLSLALLGEPVLPGITRAMNQGTPQFRILALDVLSRIGTEQARRHVANFLKDPDPHVKRAAERGVSEPGKTTNSQSF